LRVSGFYEIERGVVTADLLGELFEEHAVLLQLVDDVEHHTGKRSDASVNAPYALL